MIGKYVVLFINLFFIPMFSLGVLFNYKKPKKFFGLLLAYCKSVVLCLIFSMIICVLITYLFELIISTYSIKYTILATAVSIIWPYIFKNFEIKIEKLDKKTLEEKENKEDEKTKEPELAEEIRESGEK